jgi:hypothetical protein
MVKSSIIAEYKKEFIKNILYFHNYVKIMNGSKMFAGLVVITLNIASRFVTIKLSKSMESYLKFTFSRDVLVFCIVWMGSRDIYIAATFTLLFTFIMDFLLNEESTYCILPESFTTYHAELLDGTVPTADEIKNAESVLERVKKTN